MNKEDTKSVKKDEKVSEKVRAESKGIINVGNKPMMKYVSACIIQLSNGEKELNIRSRGHCISRAVDVAEVLKNKFKKDLKVKSVQIDTQVVEQEDNNIVNVSTINIKVGY